MQSLKARLELALRRRPTRPSELARIAGVSTASVAGWFKDTKSLKADTARRLADHFGCDRDWLGEGRGAPKWRQPVLGQVEEHDEALPMSAPGPQEPAVRTVLQVADLMEPFDQDTRDAAALLFKMVASQPGRASEIAIKLEALLAAPSPERNVAIVKTAGGTEVRTFRTRPAPGRSPAEPAPADETPHTKSRAPT
jgi:transcriptional regulator with XRE-family HTH domain